MLVAAALLASVVACTSDKDEVTDVSNENTYQTCDVDGISYRYEDMGDGAIQTTIRAKGITDTYTKNLPENTSFSDYVNNSCATTGKKAVPENASAVTLYEDCNYNGWSVPLAVGDYNFQDLVNRGAPNDKASSIRIASGFGATLYEDQNFSGRQITLRGDDSCLIDNTVGGFNFNDQLTSIRVFRIGGGGSSSFDVTQVSVSNTNNGTPRKGDQLYFDIVVRNTGTSDDTRTITPIISSRRFRDYNRASVGSAEITVRAGAALTVRFPVGPFFFDGAKRKHYALGRGDYTIDAIKINDQEDSDFRGKDFNIAGSNAILVPVMYQRDYLSRQNYSGNIQQYLTSAFSRRAELFDNGRTTAYPGGTDQMLNIRHLFYTIPVGGLSANGGVGICEKATEFAGRELGLGRNWSGPVGTQLDNHGFDYLMGLTPDWSGGVACGWINVQVTGLFTFDLSLERSQILVVHETGHILGAPHCDPLQGYVMCAGEKNQKYRDNGIYVFNIVSKNRMSNRFN